MRRLPPQLKVQQAPQPPSRFLAGLNEPPAVTVNHYSNADRLIPAIPAAIPGFKTSAAFLTSLSANLRIDPDCPSPLLTPNFRNAPLRPLPPPSPLSFAAHVTSAQNPYPSPAETEIMSLNAPADSTIPSNPTDGLPELRTYTAEAEDDRVDGLQLVADAVAQQRQVANRMLIFHPANLGVFFVVLAVLTQYIWKTPDDLAVLATTIGGMTMAYLVAVRMATGKYLAFAETVNWDWLSDDRIIVVKWGEEIIGALVLGWLDQDDKKKKNTRRRKGKAVVRAWTVKLRYRGKGIGESLLEEAVKQAGERGADGIVFDRDHANSKRALPPFYNSFLDKRDARAEKALEKVADEKGNFRQRRSSPTWGSR